MKARSTAGKLVLCNPKPKLSTLTHYKVLICFVKLCIGFFKALGIILYGL